MRLNEGDEVEEAVRQVGPATSSASMPRRASCDKLAGVDRSGAQAQDHRRGVHPCLLRRKPKKIGRRGLPGAGHHLSRRHRVRRRRRRRHQEPPQRRRSARRMLNFQEIIEPLRLLFKDEVRAARTGAGPAGVSGQSPAVPRSRPCHPHHRRHHAGEARHPARGGLHLPRRDRQGAAWTGRSEPVLRRADQHPLRGRHGRRTDLRLHSGPPRRHHRATS